MTGPVYTQVVAALPATVPFVGPEAHMRDSGRRFRARLGANESAFGPAPAAIAAMERAARETWMYGDSENHDLRDALAQLHGVRRHSIIVGEGIDGLLGYLVRMLIEPGDAVVTSDGAYPTFNYHVNGYGGVLHKVPYRDDHEDPKALLDKAAETGAKLLYISNPDNPMGTHHSGDAIAKMVEGVPEGTLLVLDEAYLEFAPGDATARIDPQDPRVIRMRTFSKAHGMAGARVGYAIGAPDLISRFDLIRNHFGMTRIAQAGALAALEDDEGWLDYVRHEVARSRDRLGRIAAANGLTALPSATNFVAIDCGEGGDFARAVLAELMARDIFVRMPGVAPLDRCIRVTAGRPTELDAFEEVLPEALRAARTG